MTVSVTVMVDDTMTLSVRDMVAVTRTVSIWVAEAVAVTETKSVSVMETVEGTEMVTALLVAETVMVVVDSASAVTVVGVTPAHLQARE